MVETIIDSNSIAKHAKIFSEQCKKFRLKIPYRFQEIPKTPKWLYSSMTPVSMFAPNQNLFYLAVSQKSKPISV